jgi:hypothetical protein
MALAFIAQPAAAQVNRDAVLRAAYCVGALNSAADIAKRDPLLEAARFIVKRKRYMAYLILWSDEMPSDLLLLANTIKKNDASDYTTRRIQVADAVLRCTEDECDLNDK